MYSRRILHYGPDAADLRGPLSDRVIAGCWFELHRQGGCGAGELTLSDRFPDRHILTPGDWIACEYAPGDRWYFGRIEEINARSPVRVRLRLEGMGVQLNEVFPGGYGPTVGDGTPPHRYARTDLFPEDPDYSLETRDSVNEPEDVVRRLVQQYVVPRTHIAYDPALVIDGPATEEVRSLKFRGEESVRTIFKELALRARGAAWGVLADGRFFFHPQPATLLATYREARDLATLEETVDREHLFNRLLLTGDYVYDGSHLSGSLGRTFFRWRGNYVQPASRDAYGERRIRLWIPWIRTRDDARHFTREFFRIYAHPTARYLAEAVRQTTLPLPWAGRIRLESRDGAELVTGVVETVRVEFDHTPKFRFELGPGDPRELWPEPPHDERWEVAGPGAPLGYGGEPLTFPGPSGPPSDDDSLDSDDSSLATETTSDDSSTDDSSDLSTATSNSDPVSSDGLDSESLDSALSSRDSDETDSADSSLPSGDEESYPSNEATGDTDESGTFDPTDDSSASSSDSSFASSSLELIDVPCCPEPLPARLTAAYIASSDCACAGAGEIPLTWNGARFVGSTPFGSCPRNLSIELYCLGTDAADFRLDTHFSDNCDGAPLIGVEPAPISTCEPLSLHFLGAVNGATACCQGVASSVSIIVTT